MCPLGPYVGGEGGRQDPKYAYVIYERFPRIRANDNNVSKTSRETGVDRMSIKRTLAQESKFVEVFNKRPSRVKYAYQWC